MLILLILILSSLSYAASTANTTTNIYILNSAPNITSISDSPDPVEITTQTMTFTANITDNNGVPQDIASVVVELNNGTGSTTDDINLTMTYNEGSGLYKNTTYFVPHSGTLGAWSYIIYATDNTGAVDSLSGAFTVQDTLRPNVTNVLPSKNITLIDDSNVSINATVTDNGIISSVIVEVTQPNNFKENVTATYLGNNVYGYTYTNTTQDGYYNATFYVYDTANNLNNSGYTYFIVGDIISPSIGQPVSTPQAVDPGNSLNITVNVTDNIAVDTVLVEIQNINYTMNDGPGNLYYYDQHDTSVPNAGTYVYTVYANDTSQNWGTPQTGNFTINPLVSITITQIPIDFGNVTVPATNRRADNGTAGSGYSGGTIKGFPMIANNTGNVQENFSISGTDLYGLTNSSYTITVSNIKYDTDNNITGASSLSGTPTRYAGNVIRFNIQNVYFWITVPTGIPSQAYQGNVTVSAQQS